MEAPAATRSAQMVRGLALWASTAVAIGQMIGQGIPPSPKLWLAGSSLNQQPWF